MTIEEIQTHIDAIMPLRDGLAKRESEHIPWDDESSRMQKELEEHLDALRSIQDDIPEQHRIGRILSESSADSYGEHLVVGFDEHGVHVPYVDGAYALMPEWITHEAFRVKFGYDVRTGESVSIIPENRRGTVSEPCSDECENAPF